MSKSQFFIHSAKITFLVLCSHLATAQSLAATQKLHISGFGSIVAGKVLSGDPDPSANGNVEFIADYTDVGIYNEKLDFSPESLFAVQAAYTASDKLDFIAQIVAKGADEFAPEVDMLYARYSPTPNTQLLFGRRPIPMYYYSEFIEVGFAYPWMRPPTNLYWWQITQFNGLTGAYDFELLDGNLTGTATAFYGNEATENNKSMTYYNSIGYYGNPNGGPGTAISTDEAWRDIKGAGLTLSHEYFDLRFSAFKHLLDRDIHYEDTSSGQLETGISNFQTDQTFVGLGGIIYYGNFNFIFDINRVTRNDSVETEYPTELFSITYTANKYTPYIVYSKADQHENTSEGREEHALTSIGLRYAIAPKAMLKVQFDDFVDQGDVATGWNYHGDAKVITLGFDFIF